MVILNRMDGILPCYNFSIIQYVPLWNQNSNKIQASVKIPSWGFKRQFKSIGHIKMTLILTGYF